MKLKKLNTRGFSHDTVLLAIVVIFAIGGVGYLVASHAATPCNTQTFAPGDTGTCVESIQRFVIQKDRDVFGSQTEYPSSKVIYGNFGSVTLGAVDEYQKDENIAITGKVDANTWSKLCGDIYYWNSPANDAHTTEFNASTFHQYADPTGCVASVQAIVSSQTTAAAQPPQDITVEHPAAIGSGSSTTSNVNGIGGSAQPSSTTIALATTGNPPVANAQQVNTATGATSSKPKPGAATAQQTNTATGAVSSSPVVTSSTPQPSTSSPSSSNPPIGSSSVLTDRSSSSAAPAKRSTVGKMIHDVAAPFVGIGHIVKSFTHDITAAF